MLYNGIEYEDYSTWLYKKLDLDQIEKDSYLMKRVVLWNLGTVEFTYFIPNDDNRAADGHALREEYIAYLKENFDDEAVKKIFELDDIKSNVECTVVEMMAALAIRIEKDIMGDVNSDENRTPIWFWAMCENLGITRLKPEVIRERAQKMVDRKYDEKGHGGLFPLSGNRFGDQREVEIWYQMAYWIQENYPDSEDDPDEF